MSNYVTSMSLSWCSRPVNVIRWNGRLFVLRRLRHIDMLVQLNRDQEKKKFRIPLLKQLSLAPSQLVSSKQQVMYDLLTAGRFFIQCIGAELFPIELGPTHIANEYMANFITNSMIFEDSLEVSKCCRLPMLLLWYTFNHIRITAQVIFYLQRKKYSQNN